MVASVVSADELPKYSVASNFGIASDYISRGLRLNWGHPAFRAGTDIMHHSGWYVSAGRSRLTGNFMPMACLGLICMQDIAGQSARPWISAEQTGCLG
jgi:hypothetical protein